MSHCQDVDEVGQDAIGESKLDKPIQERIENPIMPFIGDIPIQLEPGRMVSVRGVASSKAARFAVNLMCGSEAGDDIAFHVNPRFDQMYVARNSRIAGKWGDEEDAVPQRSPFKRSNYFHLVIFVAEGQFMVAVNGRHFCNYTFRVPLIRITTIEVTGDVVVDLIEHRKATIYPEPSPERLQLYHTIRTENSTPDDDTLTEAPYIGVLPHPFHVGSQIEFIGRVKLLPDVFYVNLQQGQQNWPHPLIVLHIKPQLLIYSYSETGVVCNAWLNGEWGPEEKKTNLPFQPGKTFTMKIVCEKDHFIITVDGKHLANFSHRCSYELIDTICIDGDVWIHDIVVKSS